MEFVYQEEPGKVPCFRVTGWGEGIRAYFTTRRGGVSRGAFASLNLGFHTGDSPDLVAANRELLATTLGLTTHRLQTTRQVHGDRVLVVRRYNPGVAADAQITALPGLALTCLVADCQAIYLYDPVHRVTGLVHAGWRGTVARIAARCLEAMSREYGTDPRDCLAALSPAAGPCCYEVGEDVAAAVRQAFPEEWRRLLLTAGKGKWKFDLWGGNALMLHAAGLRGENIKVSGLCTICRQDLFFSYRGSGGVTGRMAAILIMDKGD